MKMRKTGGKKIGEKGKGRMEKINIEGTLIT
jgi:hypothetical protein